MEYTHKPVLLDECLAGLAIKPEGIYLDGTLGRAGHSLEIVRRLTTGRLICIDRDGAALTAAEERLAPYLDRVTLVRGNFSELSQILHRLALPGVDGMLFDLGVSSPQLDDASRGFSYMQDAPLDMRMDDTAPLTAYEVVNGWSYEELRRILYAYGEERYAPVIAKTLVRERELAPIETTLQLVELIRKAMPGQALREKQHPAKRSFQAIRIAVNGELDAIPPMLTAACDGLNPGGRLAVITFHSLEDRLVKQGIGALTRGCTCPPDFPVCVCGKKPQMKWVTRKPVVSGETELAENPRARSAKLRVAEKCDVAEG
ncbi:MAG: 16S rRNA (cytosine(1402)-N(4))-methyltransferase RsmH [Oscillospiraceae bacterium]